MDRPKTRKDADARTMGIDLPEAFLPPSRRLILELAMGALGSGPILITGDAGIGKTWTVGQLLPLAPASRWIRIDLTPSDGPADLYRLIARGLGIVASGPLGPTRLDIADALADRGADGERHSLVIDEAHNLSVDVWEEVRVLANRLGQPDGLLNLILVGQTVLVRRFSTRPLAAIEARLAAHLHLRPIDVAEAGEWLARRHPGRTWSADELEAVHRDSGGNPGKLIRHSLAISAPSGLNGRPAQASAIASVPPAPTETGLDESGRRAMIAAQPSTMPMNGRPPLHVEDNSIEVGWSADEVEAADPDEDEVDSAGHERAGLTPRVEESDLAVHDHYAALQAWREWADNQEKRVNPSRSDRDLADAIDEAAEAEAADPAERVATERGTVRAEGYQHFAPFGQLFTRMSPVREPDSPNS